MVTQWTLLLMVLGGAPNYDAFSEPDGYMATKEQELAAWAMLHDPDQVDALYADAAKGSARATHVIEQLEATLAASGRQLAERATGPDCLLPAVRELNKRCRPLWSYLDFLSQNRPGGIRLRSVIFRAFAVTAHQRGLENAIILSVVNGLLSIALASSVLAELDATARPSWSATEGKTSAENALAHWKKHGAEFPEFLTAEQYAEGARRFLEHPPRGALTKVRPNGEVVVYDPPSNTFGVRAADGTPKTMFKPDPARHHYPTNVDYFNAQ